MKFSAEDVQRYLKCVHDANPIHHSIVPGQLIVQYIIKDCHDYYEVKYLRPVGVNEDIRVVSHDSGYVCQNAFGEDVICIVIK
ncbi:hypothetical protein [Staphylococcus massiliensis]|uniref:hypothetical protein n=1 Tax=Staphylococcus massiliensis TaxID=555791 RepID=UPI001EE03568|nr:hypothetical protein [Staphylococcus massiliensis]MCG3400363.1 hypothetical protein [Staphylococcus massiliensis]